VNKPTTAQPAGPALTIRVQDKVKYFLVTPRGRIGLTNAVRLRERLYGLTDAGRPLVVDLDHASLADPAALGVLIGAAHRLAALGAVLYVACTRPETLEQCELAGVDRRVRLVRTVDEAVRDVTGHDAAP
jgi:anti-anti-sigma factor